MSSTVMRVWQRRQVLRAEAAALVRALRGLAVAARQDEDSARLLRVLSIQAKAVRRFNRRADTVLVADDNPWV